MSPKAACLPVIRLNASGALEGLARTRATLVAIAIVAIA